MNPPIPRLVLFVAFVLALFLALVLSGCTSMTKRLAEIEKLQAQIDRVGLEAVEIEGNFTGLGVQIERANGRRVAHVTHRNLWIPKFYWRTSKPLVTPPPEPILEPEPENSP